MMIVNTDLKWSTDEGLTTSQIVNVDEVVYLRVTEFNDDGKVMKVTDTPAEHLRVVCKANASTS